MDVTASRGCEIIANIAWHALILSQMVLFTVLLLRRMWRRYPMLALFIGMLLFQSVATVPFGGGWRSGTDPLIWIAQCLTLCEITRALVRDYAELAKLASKFAILSVCIAGTAFVLGFPSDVLPAFLMAAQLLVLASLLLTFKVLPRPVARNLSRHTRVLTVYMGIQLARYSTAVHGNDITLITFAVAEASCFFAWVLAIRPAGECIPCAQLFSQTDLRGRA
jgi:hypothetical protein